MFDRFTDRARQCMDLALEAARAWGHDAIGTEHILLGLLREGSGVASDALKDLGIAAGEAAEAVTRRLRRGESDGQPERLPFTPAGKRVLEKALEEATDLGCSYIGTEHLLLGLLGVPETVAADALAEAGAVAGAVRGSVRDLLGIDRADAAARRAIRAARRIAHERGYDAIDVAQVLLGVLEDDSSLPPLLDALGVSAAALSGEVRRRLPPVAGELSPGQLPWTPGMRDVLRRAEEEMRRMGQHSVGVEHLFLALVAAEEAVLRQAGVTLETARECVKAPRRTGDEAIRSAREETRRAVDAAIETLKSVRAAPRGGGARDSVFDRFPDRARKCMGLARLAAQEFSHDFIGVEHILLGLLAEEGCAASRVLTDLGVDREAVARAVRGRMRLGRRVVTQGQLPFTPDVKRALECAQGAADGLGDAHIGTEHLLLGLLGVPETIAAAALAEAGVAEEPVRERVGARNELGRKLDEALRLLKEVRERLGGEE